MTTDTPRRDDRSAVGKAMALLRSFGEQAYVGVGVSELARRADLSKSTAYRLLSILQEDGTVERAGSAYRLGKVIQELGETPESEANARIREALTPFLADLFTRTRQTVHLATLDGTHVTYLNKLYGHLRVRSPSRIGGVAPAYCTGVGKVLLAYDPEAVERVLATELHAWTPHTLTTEEALRAELRTIRQDGIGYDREELMTGLTCVAAPVMGPDGRPVAALSVSGPATSFQPESQAMMLRQACHGARRTVAAVFGTQSR
jgi:IclR family transcriptional regulator, KDG regulon repressor